MGGIIDPSLNFFVGEVLFREFQPLPITNLERSSATLTFGSAKVRGGKKKNIWDFKFGQYCDPLTLSVEGSARYLTGREDRSDDLFKDWL